MWLSPRPPREGIARKICRSFLPDNPSREVMTIYGTLYPIASKIRISPAVNKSDPKVAPPIYILAKPSWFFLVDHNSLMRFAHRVTYIIAPVNGSTFEVHEEQWWPVIEGQSHWHRDGHIDAPREFVVFEGVIAYDWRANGRDHA
jgi:hypothetical protein